MVGWSFLTWPFRSLFLPPSHSPSSKEGQIGLNPSSLITLANLQPPTIGLKLLHAGVRPVFDIVAVHGLNGDAYRTWTWKAIKKNESDILWLRDLLPNEIQDARIFTYGYDSMPAAVAGSASTKFIHQHAETFLQDLHAHRKGEEVYRPIIFIAHSLGGILVKQALINSSNCHVGHNEHLRSIVNSTYGIIFMGTPHSGSDLASWGRFAESIISHIFPKVFLDTNPHLINTLGRNSEILQQITESFKSIQHQQMLRIFYFWEELKTKLPNGRMEMVVEYSSAVPDTTPNVQSYGIHGDHTSISRFQNEESPGYEVLVRALTDWRDAAPEVIARRWAEYLDHVKLSSMHRLPQRVIGDNTFFLPSPPPIWSPASPPVRGLIQPSSPDDNISPSSSTIITRPQPKFIVPHRENAVFEGRQEDLEHLHKILQSPRKRERGNASAVVSGISGSGKTHLVRQYVYEKRKDYPGGIFWVESMSSLTIKLGYWKLAIGLELTKDARQDVPHNDFFIQLVIDWFQNNSKWLLILDGADHETDEEVDLLNEIIPGGKDGAIIITSVNKALAGSARLGSPEGVSLKSLETDDCIRMLFQYTQIEDPTEEEKQQAKELVELMGHLPLAIHSAASAMKAMGMKLGCYLREYKKQPLVERLTSFNIVLDQLEKRYIEASNLINILSFVERKVPVAMIEWGIKNWAGPKLVSGNDGFGLNVTLGHLLSYSLIERSQVVEVDDSGRVDTLLVHKVVQDICRLRMKQEGSIEKWFQFTSRLFCRSFRRMERRRQDKEFSISDYRRFQVHIAKIMAHGLSMKLKSGGLLELEDTLERIKLGITRYTPKYRGSQSSADGDADGREYMPPKSQFSGSWSSLDESSGSTAETMSSEIVYAPDYPVVESPSDHWYQDQDLFMPGAFESHTPTVRASDSPRQLPSLDIRTPSPRGISEHPYGLPSGSPPTDTKKPPHPPPLQREIIPGLGPRLRPNTHISNHPLQGLPYPPTPGGPAQFPPYPQPPDAYFDVQPVTMIRNYSDPALHRTHSPVTGVYGHGSRSQCDLTAGHGRQIPGGLPMSREGSKGSAHSRDPSQTRVEPVHPRVEVLMENEFGLVGMSRVHSEGSGRRVTRLGDGIGGLPASEPMSRSTSAGSTVGGVPLPRHSIQGISMPQSEPMSRSGSAGSRDSISGSAPRYHKLASRQSLPIPTISADSGIPEHRDPHSEERAGYHSRKGSAPGLYLGDAGYDSGIDGIGTKFVEFGTPPPQTLILGSTPPSGPASGLSPATNPAEYLAASRPASAPGIVQDPHHHNSHSQHQQTATQHPSIPIHRHSGSLPSTNSGSPATIFSRSPSPASIIEAADAPMQRSASEPKGTTGSGRETRGLEYSPREKFLEFEGEVARERDGEYEGDVEGEGEDWGSGIAGVGSGGLMFEPWPEEREKEEKRG
ncbi:hypothetical protein BDZ91DRAFT_794532 [Kalaharituber pfeilii]|nr:hypothetical protein BDZ91DRAFT_794532 [Kalaharituber pfeilii]